MKNKIIIALLFIGFAFSSNAQNLKSVSTPLHTKKLDSLFEALEKNDKAMGSVAIRQDGKLVYSNSIGFKSNNNTQPINAVPSTVYRIGSISKMYTAAMVFQLIQKGELGMETVLSDYFPTIPNANKITIRQLLGHTSGIFNITSDSTFDSWYQNPISKEQMISKIAAHTPFFEPDAKTQYSNSNYILLGYILEAISKKSYQQNLQSTINSITGAKQTNYGGKIDLSKNEAFSFSYQNKQWTKQPETNLSVPHGAGAITATANEMALFAENYIGGTILNQQWKDTITKITKNLGYGIMKYELENEVGYGHTGAIDGFNSCVIFFPEKKISIAFLSNGINYSIDDIMMAVYKIYTGADYKIPSFITIQLSEKELEKFNGVYSSDKIALKLTITNKNNTLMLQADGQPEFPMDATAPTTFSNGQIGVEISFNSNSELSVNELLLKQGGGTISFNKQKQF